MLTPDQRTKIVEALAKKGITTLLCPACGGRTAGVGQQLVTVASVERSELYGWNTVHRGLLLATLDCQTCGYTWLFGVEQLGLGEYFGWP